MPEPSEQSSPRSLNPESWVDLYGNYLYHFARGRLRNTTDAENAVQETFLAALKAKDNFAGNSTERTWLTGILKHKIIDHMRKSYREKPVTDMQENTDAVNQFFDRTEHLKKQPSKWLPKPDELLEKKEFWKVFHKCSEKLPKTAGDAFLLREVEKMDSKDICKTLNITPSNHRARLFLRQCLEINWFERKPERL